MLQYLWSHVERSAYHTLLQLIPINDTLCEAEVSQFQLSIMDHYIFWFHVSMDDTVVYELEESHADLFEIADSDGLRKNLVFLDCCTQISPITKFLSNVVVVPRFQYVNESNNVLALQLPHNSDFTYQGVLDVLVLVD